MAQKVQILLVDDIDESEASQTVQFGLDGTQYEIDLNDKHAEQLRKGLTKFVDVARKTGKAAARGARATAPPAGPNPKDVRAWARAEGIEVPDRGRIPEEIRQKYLDARK